MGSIQLGPMIDYLGATTYSLGGERSVANYQRNTASKVAVLKARTAARLPNEKYLVVWKLHSGFVQSAGSNWEIPAGWEFEVFRQ